MLYGTGFGPTNPTVPADQVFSGAAALTEPVSVTIGGVPAEVVFAGMTGNGLVQLNVIVPQIAAGEHVAVVTVGGLSAQSGVLISVN